MILKKYKLNFEKPKYSITCENISINKILIQNSKVFLKNNSNIYTFDKGSSINDIYSFEFYTIILPGRNHKNLVKKYFYQVLKDESKFSINHYNRFLKYIEDFNL